MSEAIISQAFPGWEVREPLGHGAYGQVYRCVKQEFSTEMQAAIKVITIPKDETELAERAAEGMDENAIYNYYKGLVEDCVQEIRVMAAVKSASNVVSVEDFTVIEKTDGVGWYVLIRMELLKSFTAYAKNRRFTEEEVIDLGIDICSALEVCHKQHIIHRDIKPANIMVTEYGEFKLGDFGIARKLQQGMGDHLSSKGTQAFMAPEVPGRRPYDERADIYSLGLVLYQMVNNGRPPFVDPNKPQFTYEDKEQAIRRRFSGDPLPPPPFASPALQSVILRACSFRQLSRYATATDMKRALEQAKRDPGTRGSKIPIGNDVSGGGPSGGYTGGPSGGYTGGGPSGGPGRGPMGGGPSGGPGRGPMGGGSSGGPGRGPMGGGQYRPPAQPVQQQKKSSNGYLAVGVIAITAVIALVSVMIVYLVNENVASQFSVNGVYAITEETETAEGVLLRETASAGSATLDTIPAGFFVCVTEEAHGGYVQIQYKNLTGYVKHKYLEGKYGTFIWNTVGKNGVDVHAEPNINSKRSYTLGEGTPVEPQSKVSNGYILVKTTINGELITGWVDVQFVKTNEPKDQD